MSSTKDKSYYKYYCLINASKDFKNVSLFSGLVDCHDISISSKTFSTSEECVLACANFVKKVMSEVNQISDNSYKLLWDVADKKDLIDPAAAELTVAKFYLVNADYIGKSLGELPTNFSANVIKVNNESVFKLAENNFSEKNRTN